MATTPKWTEERTTELTNFVGDESPVSQGTVNEAGLLLETSTRSISSKLRKMGFDVELAASAKGKSFTDTQEATLSAFVVDNSGQYTYAEIAGLFENGAFSAKSIQGKILSMELTAHVKAAPKVENIRKYSPEEETAFVAMVHNGAFVEDIAEAMGRSVNSIRGKALSLLRAGEIDAIPRQATTKGSDKSDPLEGVDVANLTVEAIAEAIGKTARGVKTMLTRRGVAASDYDGAAKAAKAAQ